MSVKEPGARRKKKGKQIERIEKYSMNTSCKEGGGKEGKKKEKKKNVAFDSRFTHRKHAVEEAIQESSRDRHGKARAEPKQKRTNHVDGDSNYENRLPSDAVRKGSATVSRDLKG